MDEGDNPPRNYIRAYRCNMQYLIMMLISPNKFHSTLYEKFSLLWTCLMWKDDLKRISVLKPGKLGRALVQVLRNGEKTCRSWRNRPKTRTKRVLKVLGRVPCTHRVKKRVLGFFFFGGGGRGVVLIQTWTLTLKGRVGLRFWVFRCFPALIPDLLQSPIYFPYQRSKFSSVGSDLLR